MRKLIVVLATLAGVSTMLGVASVSAAQVVASPPDEPLTSVLVSVTDLGLAGDADLLAHELELAHGGDIRPTAALDELNLIAADVTPAGAAALAQAPFVESVEPSHEFHPMLDVSVPTVGGVDTRAAGFSGAGKVVAVIDSGVDGSTPGLVGSVVGEAEACFVPDTYVAPTVLVEGCTAGATGPGSAAPCLLLPGECSHGTRVAGIISASDATYNGVAPDVGILAIRVFGVIDDGSGPKPDIPEAGVLQALQYVYEQSANFDITSVNLSLGGAPGDCVSASWSDIVGRLASKGIAVVAASGNDGWGAALDPTTQLPTDAISFPACLPGVISVGSTTPSGTVSAFTNSSNLLDLVAPGDPITSTVPTSFAPSGFAPDTGTSFSSPHVAAAIAVLDQMWPGMSVERKRTLLRAAGSMVLRATPDVGDVELRFPELRLAGLIGFVPFVDSVDDAFWAAPADWSKYTGVANGFADGTFGANTPLNRAQAVTFLWHLMGSQIVAPTLPAFTDVQPDSFYEQAVEWARASGVTLGTSDTTFSPSDPVTRLQVATFMWRMAGKPAAAVASSFLDRPQDPSFAAAIDWMAANEITAGTDTDGFFFSPGWTIDRGQMITFMYRLINASGAWTGTVLPPALALF